METELARQARFIELAITAGELEMYICTSRVEAGVGMPREGDHYNVWVQGPYVDDHFTPEMDEVTHELESYIPMMIDFAISADTEG